MRPVVVCVDDSEEVLSSLRRRLKGEPYELRLTDDPRRVLEWIAEGPVDLVLADQRMPALSGLELLETVRDCSPETALILMSGVPDSELELRRSELRRERFVPKPWDGDEPRLSIRRALDRRPPGDEIVEIHVDCAGRDARSVSQEILARSARTRGVVVLSRLSRLDDSVCRLLKNLARAVSWLHGSLELRDPDGLIAAFLEALAPPRPRS